MFENPKYVFSSLYRLLFCTVFENKSLRSSRQNLPFGPPSGTVKSFLALFLSTRKPIASRNSGVISTPDAHNLSTRPLNLRKGSSIL